MNPLYTKSNKICCCLVSVLPIVNFHMLTIEEEHSCWNQSNVKVTCVNRHGVNIHNVYVSHTRNIMGRLGQLFCQGKTMHYKIMRRTENCEQQ